MQKVADASGAKYSGGGAASPAPGPPPPVASKPAFMPTRSVGGSGFNPLASSRTRQGTQQDGNVDEDGWGADAPPVTRSQLEKVKPAYQPTKVNMADLTKQKPEPSKFGGNARPNPENDSGDLVRGGYQPVGKVDIAAIRAQAQKKEDDRPTIVKGAYEPVGKVDIAAIRAKAQKPSDDGPRQLSPSGTGPSASSGGEDEPKSLASRSAAFTQSERLTTLPKPKIANKFGSNASFTGTKAPTPGVFGLQSAPPTATAPPVGAASRTFADEGGKTPAQIWAEKKARQQGLGGAGDASQSSAAPPITSQTSGGGGEWKSGYAGKSWAPVAITTTGRSGTSSIGQQRTGEQDHQEEDTPTSPAGGISSIRDRFKGGVPMGAPSLPRTTTGERSPPPLDTASKPTGGIPMPGLPSRPAQDDEDERPNIPIPPRVQRSPTPESPVREPSPVRIAMPVARGQETHVDAPEERFSPPVVPTESIEKNLPHEDRLTEEPRGHDPARGAGAAVAAASFGAGAAAGAAVGVAVQGSQGGGQRALVQYDYEKAEDNELELTEGDFVTNIEMVDEDWWMGTNSKGESGLFPSNYVELVDGEEEEEAPPAPVSHEPTPSAPAPSSSSAPAGPTASAIYDYEAAEDNELSFPEGGTITGLVRL